jgi:hypothetical protein
MHKCIHLNLRFLCPTHTQRQVGHFGRALWRHFESRIFFPHSTTYASCPLQNKVTSDFFCVAFVCRASEWRHREHKQRRRLFVLNLGFPRRALDNDAVLNVNTRAGLALWNAFSGRAQALYRRLGLLRAWIGLVCGLGVCTASGLSPKFRAWAQPGPSKCWNL